MIKKIPLIPDVPHELREAAQFGKIIPFIGAGLSMLAGSPSWNDLADNALKVLIKRNHLSYSELEQLRHLSPRIKLSLAKSLDTRGILNFEQLIMPNIGEKIKETGNEAYSYIEGIANSFVTTNYDSWLKYKKYQFPQTTQADITIPERQERTLIYQRENFRIDLLNQEDTVIQLHGSVKEANSMVMSTQDYLEHYARDTKNNENPVLTFLTDLFRLKTVIFIGYGLDELEILEFIIKKGNSRLNSPKPTHYILQGFFSNQADLASHLRSYYLTLGIELIPFSRDKRDWNQLIYVLQHLSKEIPCTKMLTIMEQVEMKNLLDEYE